MSEIDDEDVMNVGLVAAAQAVEHYEITRYGALIAWAGELGRTDCIPLFQANLAEEKATDEKLTRMAEKRFNPQATQKAGEEARQEAGEKGKEHTRAAVRRRPSARRRRRSRPRARRRAARA